jgi:hypothetical protein
MEDSSDQQQQQRPSTTTTTTTNRAQAPQPTTKKKKTQNKNKAPAQGGKSGSTAQILCDFLSFFFLFCPLCPQEATNGRDQRASACEQKERTKPALQIRPPNLSSFKK